MKTGTRRMWSRRVLRAGWFLAPVLRFPVDFAKFFFGSWNATFNTLIFGGLAMGVVACTVTDIKDAKIASATDIETALKGNHCMIDLVPRRQTIDLKGGPLTIGHLRRAKRDCEVHWEAVGQVQEQKAALKRLGAK